MTAVRRKIDIEALVTWAYRDELPKRKLVAGEGGTREYDPGGSGGGLGDVIGDDDDTHSFQRYASVTSPHPDAAIVESAVSSLNNELIVEWPTFRAQFMADVIGITPTADIFVKDIERGAKVVATNEPGVHARAVSTILVRRQVFSPQALVVMHAINGSRPRWHVGAPRPAPISVGNNRIAVNGSCEGKDRYSKGSACPLDWSGRKIGAPTIEAIAFARLEFFAWREGLVTLAQQLGGDWLGAHEPLPPAVPEKPWVTGLPASTRIWRSGVVGPSPANDDKPETTPHPDGA